MAQRKQDQLDRMRRAFGLKDVKEGEAFDRELQVRRHYSGNTLSAPAGAWILASTFRK